MQKWQYAQVRIEPEGKAHILFLTPEVEGKNEVIELSQNDRHTWGQLNSIVTTMGLRGWELVGVTHNFYYFKRPIE